MITIKDLEDKINLIDNKSIPIKIKYNNTFIPATTSYFINIIEDNDTTQCLIID